MNTEFDLFLAAFQRLRNYVDNDLVYLTSNWRGDDELIRLAKATHDAQGSIELMERFSPVGFARDIPRNSVTLRREYDRRWQAVVARIADWELNEILEAVLVRAGVLAEDGSPRRLTDEDRLANLQEDAESEEKNLRSAFDILHERFADSEDDAEWFWHAERAWETLLGPWHLDVAGALWRRRALPFVLGSGLIRATR